MKITIIGINDRLPEFTEEVQTFIASVNFFAGGNRHHELVKQFLPEKYHWSPIVVPLSGLFEDIQNKKGNWVVFASGDPLFFGIGNTLKREFPDSEIKVLPQFNSLQLLAHRLGLNYGEFPVVSLTGRPWHEFDKALIQGTNRMAILTDRKKTPVEIIGRMLNYGYSNYRIYYGEKMGGENERVMVLDAEDISKLDFKHPNCFFLEKTDDAIPARGIPEESFEPLEGRPRMITKMPIRITTLALMQLLRRKVFWDVGACTGSVSIEARLKHPHLQITAFEIRSESEGIIHRNAQKFQAPGIYLIVGDFLKAKKEKLAAPDAVFIGGYGGKMEEVLDDVNKYLLVGGVIGFNSVSGQSRTRFLSWCSHNRFEITQQQQIQVDDHNPISILIAEKKR
ncbi:bifunctional cobalt-precorrin-7 (C(5))-methyltransferase/cobalt-precorrin-6B (C(15))-methyltransferase [Marinilabilia salmonicolor]|uniref:bifunctional cobalt-precorrin-7 (C(5))-methyltransferase/cobalt-precorrin-6B (C(15))-methyltransferase n=1 Tax=Marinilabilia salmonicolor TaxID=989 RepID=UPI00029AD184|nr:bifunctional cobalt-precorrin-7 (C(5))-methyltransferase/cobalt-precorrin-6B (C(15))-methyltransferase [Marinilabilia salmonicolor]